MLDTNNPDRPKAMLTKDERRGLINDWRGMKRKNRSYHQKETVKRARNTLLDFSLLFEKLPENRRREVSDIGDSPTTVEKNAFHDAFVDTIAFIYLLLEENPNIYGFRRSFASVVEAGVAKAVEEIHGPFPWTSQVDVTLRVDENHIEPTDVDRILHRIAEGDVAELSAGELRGLIRLAEQGEHAHSSFVNGWADLGEQIAELRAERDDIVTPDEMEEFANLSKEERTERLQDDSLHSDEA